MRNLLLLLAAAAVGACTTPTPIAPPPAAPGSPAAAAGLPVVTTGQPAAPTAQPGAPVAAPATPAETTLAGTVLAPSSFRAIGEEPARYLLGLKAKQKAMANTEVFVTDDKGQSLGITGKTDANGNYTLVITLELAGKPLVINARVLDQYGRPATLKAIARGKPGLQVQASVDFASTLVASHALADGALGDYSEETYANILAKLEESLEEGDVANFNLNNLRNVLKELADIVDADPELEGDFAAFGEGDAGGGNDSRDGSSDRSTSDDSTPILSGQVQ